MIHMSTPSTIIKYAAAAILVMILGGLAGWYVFVHRQISATESADSARGFGEDASFASGSGSSFGNISTEATDVGIAVQAGNRAPKLWQLTRTPVAGAGFEASTTKLYFAERASGNILVADPGRSTIERRTNTLFSKTYESIFARDGSVILRGISDSGDISSFAARIASSTSPVAGDTPNKLEGVYLPNDIIDISARSKDQLFFIIPDPAGGSTGITSDWKGAGQKRVFSSALTNWRVWYLSDGAIYILLSASDDVLGNAFKLNSDGTLTSVVGNVPGLTILPRANSSALIFGSSEGGDVALFSKASAGATAVRLPIRTIADKCVWESSRELIAYCAVPETPPGASYLRNWYSGNVHSSDSIWRVDVSAGTTERVYSPIESVALDVENLHIDDSGSYLSFMNAADKSLWMLTL